MVLLAGACRPSEEKVATFLPFTDNRLVAYDLRTGVKTTVEFAFHSSIVRGPHSSTGRPGLGVGPVPFRFTEFTEVPDPTAPGYRMHAKVDVFAENAGGNLPPVGDENPVEHSL